MYHTTTLTPPQIIEASKAWKEAWVAILTHQHRIYSEFEVLYEPILGSGPDYQGHVAVETPEKTMARTTRMKAESEELKRDLSEDVNMVDDRMIRPTQSAKDSLLTMRRTIKRREDKKLDFERYQSRVDSAIKKKVLSERDKTTLTKAQSDLATATEAYTAADDHLRHCLPPVLTAVFSLLPHLLAAQIQIQNTLLGHYYTSIHTYCSQEGFPNPAPAMDEVIRTWSDIFLPLQSETESLPILAGGKAVKMPMQLENGYTNGHSHRRPSAISQRGKSVSPARALPPSPNYDVKPRISASPSPSAIPLLSPQADVVRSPSPTISAYASPASAPLTSFAPAGPNSDYFSRDRQTSTNSTHSNFPSSSSLSAQIAKKKPPPPPPRANTQHFIFVTALYDFSGQGEGDLSFREGDKIKVIKSTQSKDDWWQGELRGIKGPFPANYCE